MPIDDQHIADTDYINQLLDKDYDEISAISRDLAEDYNILKQQLHKIVLNSTNIALDNVESCTNTFKLTKTLHKQYTTLTQHLLKHDSHKMLSAVIPPLQLAKSRLLELLESVKLSYGRRDSYAFLSGLPVFGALDLPTEESAGLLIEFMERLRQVGCDSRMLEILQSRINICLNTKETDLINSFTHNLEETKAIVKQLELIGANNIHTKYLLHHYRNLIGRLSSHPIHALMHDLLNIVGTYSIVFGNDVNLSAFFNEVLCAVMERVRVSGVSQDEVEVLSEASSSFGKFGFSFFPLLSSVGGREGS